jgi:hypothetical protein
MYCTPALIMTLKHYRIQILKTLLVNGSVGSKVVLVNSLQPSWIIMSMRNEMHVDDGQCGPQIVQKPQKRCLHDEFETLKGGKR